MRQTDQSCVVFSPIRRQLLALPLALWAGNLLAAGATTPLPAGACPLNSGGPSLLGTRWRLFSIYGNEVPRVLKISMEVEQTAMAGLGGCNTYSAKFEQVGNRGFKVTSIQQTRKPCEVLRPEPGRPTIDVGSWEGQYLKVLRRAGSVQQVGATLHFFDFNGAPSVIFAKQYGTGIIPPVPAPAPAT